MTDIEDAFAETVVGYWRPDTREVLNDPETLKPGELGNVLVETVIDGSADVDIMLNDLESCSADRLTTRRVDSVVSKASSLVFDPKLRLLWTEVV